MGRHHAETGAADPKRLFENGVEYRCEIPGRGIDDLQHFGSRGLLLTLFGKFSLTLGKLTFEIGYTLLGIC
jgi:hypothetical protein